MALTLGHHVFAGVHEGALSKLLNAFWASRPKYFFYTCPPLGTGTLRPRIPIPHNAEIWATTFRKAGISHRVFMFGTRQNNHYLSRSSEVCKLGATISQRFPVFGRSHVVGVIFEYAAFS